MLTISKVDPEYKIYKEATTVLFGCGQIGKKIGMMFERLGIPISYFCDNNSQLWGTSFLGVPVISPEDLKALAEKENVVLQISVGDKIHGDVFNQVKEFPLAEVIWYEECMMIFSYYYRCNLFSSSKVLFEEYEKYQTEEFKNTKTFMKWPVCNLDDSCIFVNMVGKTGDYTIIETLKNYQVPLCQTHNHNFFPEDFFSGMEKVKIITAIRDSIALDISFLYQIIDRLSVFQIPYEFYLNRERGVQDIFATIFGTLHKQEESYGYCPLYHFFDQKNSTVPHEKNTTVHRWFERQGQAVVNVLDHPFDQEKGYTIIKEGKYEIFFYQLEKLNDLIPELSEWVGVPFDKLVNSNEASSKWVAESYKQAQKELKFSQEYFDRSYDSPYMQHCYAPEDIEKFKARWRKNIDPSL